MAMGYASGAHVPDVRSAPVLAHHYFRLTLTEIGAIGAFQRFFKSV
tara:strand:- start:478 stop:615 length:138 start_codon:yes stop_codon:yes gene_type:complete